MSDVILGRPPEPAEFVLKPGKTGVTDTVVVTWPDVLFEDAWIELFEAGKCWLANLTQIDTGSITAITLSDHTVVVTAEVPVGTKWEAGDVYCLQRQGEVLHFSRRPTALAMLDNDDYLFGWKKNMTWGLLVSPIPAAPDGAIIGGLPPSTWPRLTPVASDAMGELLVQHLTGLPVIWKPLDANGLSVFDAHRDGEGYSLADWERDRDSGLYSEEELAAWQRGCFLRIRMTRAEAEAHWADLLDPPDDQTEVIKKILGTTSIKLEEALKELNMSLPEPRLQSRVVKAYEVKDLEEACLEYTQDESKNVIRREWTANTPRAVNIATEEVLRRLALFDTRANAVLTVGTGKVHATITAALLACATGDSIECYATVGNTYNEQPDYSNRAVCVLGMVANMGLLITFNTATTTVSLTAGAFGQRLLYNFTVTNTRVGSGGCVGTGSNTPFKLINCRMTGAGGTGWVGNINCTSEARNCIFDNCNIGAGGAVIQSLIFDHCTFVKCSTYGVRAYGFYAYASWCLAAGNTTQDFFGDANFLARTLCCVSGDASATGPGCATLFLTADFVNYAGDDFRLRAAVIGTTKAKLYGHVGVRDDAWGGIRRHYALCFGYAGAHDPDPGIIPAVGQVLTPAAGGPTVYGLDNELIGAYARAFGIIKGAFKRSVRS